MKHRIEKLIRIVLVLVLGIGMCMAVRAENVQPTSVSVAIPVRFTSGSVPDDLTVTVRNNAGEVIKSFVGEDMKNTGETFEIVLSYTEPGNYAYTVNVASGSESETFTASVAVLSDDDGILNAAMVLRRQNAGTKLEQIDVGNWKGNVTPSAPQNPPSVPSRPSTNQILGAESLLWYLPILLMLIGIVLEAAALICKRKVWRQL